MIKTRYTLILLSVLLFGCKKDDNGVRQAVDYNKLTYVLADNYNFGAFSRILKVTGQDKLLTTDGLFTVLASGDDAFLKAGYDTASVHNLPKAELQKLVSFHVLNGEYELDKLPLKFNQELRAHGGSLFVTKWVKDADTMLTINGKKMLAPKNTKTNNGILQIVDATINTQNHGTLYEALSSNANTSLFLYAVERAGVGTLLKDPKAVFTVFAPNNEAMKGFGIHSLNDIKALPVEELAKMVKYHMMQGRRFEHDFILSLLTPTTSGQIEVLNTNGLYSLTNGTLTDQIAYMYEGSQIKLSVETGTVNNITSSRFKFKEARNKRVYIVDEDIPVGNGVLHVLGDVLRYKK